MADWEKSLGFNDIHIVAEKLHDAIKSGIRIFLFSGEVGAGKTSLIKLLAQKIGVDTPVQSPTFGVVHDYNSPLGKIQHSDWYRIRSVNELIEMGLHEDLESDLWFIEWPEIGMPILRDLPHVHLEIDLPLEIDTPNRTYRIINYTP